MWQNAVGNLIEEDPTQPDAPDRLTFRAMTGRGDTKSSWDPNNPDEVDLARKNFQNAIERGMKAFRMLPDGKSGGQMTEFDPRAGTVLFVPPMKGG